MSPGSVNWKLATKPPIKLPFRKLENCNQVVKIGKQLKFSLVNLAGNDIVQGNKKLIVGESVCIIFFLVALMDHPLNILFVASYNSSFLVFFQHFCGN